MISRNKKPVLVIALIAFSCNFGIGQSKKIDINRIDIKDNIEHHFKFFSDSLYKHDADWQKGKGYFSVIIHDATGPYKKDSIPIRHYDLNFTNLPFDDDDNSFPLFYSEVVGRPVRIRFEKVFSPEKFMNYTFSRKSVKRFRRAIEPFLYPGEMAYDPSTPKEKGENPKWYRPVVMKLNHSFLRVTVFNDGSSKRKLIFDGQ